MDNLDIEIEEAKERFLEWLDKRASDELYKLNFWYHWNNFGIIFIDNRGSNLTPIPLVYKSIENEEIKKFWTTPTTYKEIEFIKPDTYQMHWLSMDRPYFMGCDEFGNELWSHKEDGFHYDKSKLD